MLLNLFQIKKTSISYDLMNPSTSKLLQPIMTIAVAPKGKSVPLRKTIKKTGILKKNKKKRKIPPNKQKAVANTSDDIIFSMHNCP